MPRLVGPRWPPAKRPTSHKNKRNKFHKEQFLEIAQFLEVCGLRSSSLNLKIGKTWGIREGGHTKTRHVEGAKAIDAHRLRDHLIHQLLSSHPYILTTYKRRQLVVLVAWLDGLTVLHGSLGAKECACQISQLRSAICSAVATTLLAVHPAKTPSTCAHCGAKSREACAFPDFGVPVMVLSYVESWRFQYQEKLAFSADM